MTAHELKQGINRVLENMDSKIKGGKYDSVEAQDLLFGTACVESDCGRYLYQNDGDDDIFDGGLGVFQMEAKTAIDIWDNYISYRPHLSKFMIQEFILIDEKSMVTLLIDNLDYAIVMSRLHYYRKKEKLPSEVGAMAGYWKKHYNTELGKGKEEDFIFKFGLYS